MPEESPEQSYRHAMQEALLQGERARLRWMALLAIVIGLLASLLLFSAEFGYIRRECLVMLLF